MDVDDGQRSFHLAEFAALRQEIADAVKTCNGNFRWAAIGSAAIVSWLIDPKNTPDAMPILVARLLPLVLTLFLAVMTLFIYQRISVIAGYLRDLEDALGHPTLGWEKVFAERSYKLGGIFLGAWVALFALDCVAAWVYHPPSMVCPGAATNSPATSSACSKPAAPPAGAH